MATGNKTLFDFFAEEIEDDNTITLNTNEGTFFDAFDEWYTCTISSWSSGTSTYGTYNIPTPNDVIFSLGETTVSMEDIIGQMDAMQDKIDFLEEVIKNDEKLRVKYDRALVFKTLSE
jgi:hypothetical protein